MTVFEDARPKKSDYRRFRLENLENQDDYASMEQVLRRRFAHFLQGDAGFSQRPDLLLIDGGAEHAKIARRALAELSLEIPAVGMVKDDRHRTRALVWPDGREVGIAAQPALFALVGRIQEETHRFAIEYNRQLRSRRVRASSLEKIPGVGPKRRQALLRRFGSIAAIEKAAPEALAELLPAPAARAVYDYFHPKEEAACASSPEAPAEQP